MDNSITVQEMSFANQDNLNLKKGFKKIGKGFKKAGKAVKKAVGYASAYTVLLPLAPIMGAALKDKGFTPPKNLQKRSELFYNEIVAKKNSKFAPIDFDSLDSSFQDNIAPAIVPPIIAFVKELMALKKAGKKLNAAQDKIAKAGIAVESKLKEEAKAEVAGETGKFVLKNSPIILVAFSVIVIAIVVLVAKKYA